MKKKILTLLLVNRSRLHLKAIVFKALGVGLLVTTVCTNTLFSKATNQTFLTPRPQGANLPIVYTTFNQMLTLKEDNRFGSDVAITAFYQESENTSNLGKYFGVNKKNDFELKEGSSGDVNSLFILHRKGGYDQSLAKIKFEPKQKSFGVRLDYQQNLDAFIDGLFFKVAIPVVYTQNQMKMTVHDAYSTTTKDYIENYFKGDFEGFTSNPEYEDKMKKLEYAKIDNKNRSLTQVADIDLMLGYKAVDKDIAHVYIDFALTIPTGSKADCRYVFEPVIGNHKHWGLGGDINADLSFWKSGKHNLKGIVAFNYRYIFKDTEFRTIGLLDNDENKLNFGQYYLIGQEGDTSGTPLANLLTTKMHVEPGSQIDALLGFVYMYGGFTLDLGYNLFWKDVEKVSIKDWEDDKYGLIYRNWDMHTALTKADSCWDDGTGTPKTYEYCLRINKINFNLDAAESPLQAIHKIYGGIGYVTKDAKHPVLIGIGASYDIVADDAIQNWAVWAKMGVGF